MADLSFASKLESKTFALVRTPKTLSEPYDEFHPNWIEFAHQCNDKPVKLIKQKIMMHAPDGILSEVCLLGWAVAVSFDIKGIKPGPDCASWFPDKWLSPLEERQQPLF